MGDVFNTFIGRRGIWCKGILFFIHYL
jgi:hypothetical protein